MVPREASTAPIFFWRKTDGCGSGDGDGDVASKRSPRRIRNNTSHRNLTQDDSEQARDREFVTPCCSGDD
jgi:hypothetical protein